jgi:hypothetical protein
MERISEDQNEAFLYAQVGPMATSSTVINTVRNNIRSNNDE